MGDKIPNYMKFVLGGSAGMSATLFVQPLDLVKNRMQLSGVGSGAKEYRTSFHALTGILKNEGIFALYNGLSAGLLRQATYTTTRLGTYNWLFELSKGSSGEQPSFLKKALLGMTAGVVGSFVGTPTEVALIRMCADGKLPPNERRNYSNVFNAITRMFTEEGVRGMWKGAVPTMLRAMVVNAAQLASYSQAKEMLLKTGYFNEDFVLFFVSSMISGLVTTIASMPVDILKTRIQNMKTVNGKAEYSGAGDVFLKVVRKEGIFALWKGFTPYYARLGPHTVLTFMFLEKFNETYIKYIVKVDSVS